MTRETPVENLSLNFEPIKVSYAKGDDSFDFTATPVTQKVALLLPAVQIVREGRPDPDLDLDLAYAPADDGATATATAAEARGGAMEIEIELHWEDAGGSDFMF